MSNLLDYLDPQYSQYCTSELQEDYLAAYQASQGNCAAAARAVGATTSAIRNAMIRIETAATRAGYSPDHDMVKTCPDGFLVKGVSTLYGKDGEKKIQWVKTAIDAERQKELMIEAIEAFCDDMPAINSVPTPIFIDEDLMTIYPLGDPHIGMMAWMEETGENWDLKVAESKMCAVFHRLVKAAPPSAKAVIVNLGDFFHADNMEGTTSRSGHSLDMDGRYAKMIRVGVKIIRQMIDSALAHHAEVEVINAVGNHDDTGSLFLSVCLQNIYENEPRVTINANPTPFHYFNWGSSMFGVHHGHTCKADRLPMVMATDQAELWGKTEFRTWLTGHIHHDTKKEYSGCDVESFRTLAAKDAYATWGGYRARQDSKAIVVHKSFGEIERHTINIKQVR